MNRATCQRISGDIGSRRCALRWIDCMLRQRDGVPLKGRVSVANADSTHRVVSANHRMGRLFLQGLGALKGLA